MSKQIATINDVTLTEKDFYQSIDNEIVHLNDTGDINHAAKVLQGLDKIDDVAGHAKAKLLYAMNEWHKQNKPDDDFGDYVESVTSMKKITVSRYVAVQRYVEDYTIPKEIAQRPMRDLVPIAKTLSQGYDISKSDWRKINLCASDGELRDVLRTIKGKPERKNARVIKLARDGSLYGYKNNQKYFIGFLNIKDAEDDIVLAEFIEKIKISAGVIEE